MIAIVSNHQVLSLTNAEEGNELTNGHESVLIPPEIIESNGKRPDRRSLATTITADMQLLLDLGKSHRFAKLIGDDFIFDVYNYSLTKNKI